MIGLASPQCTGQGLDLWVSGGSESVMTMTFEPMGGYIVAEGVQGRFARQLSLGGAGCEQQRGRLHRRVLTVRLPVAEKATPRRIQIGHNGAGRAIVAGGSS